MPDFPAIIHVAVTVSDLDTSRSWYQRLIDRDPALDEEADGFYHVVFPIGGGMLLGLHTHAATDQSDRFEETRIGMDHIAFGCADRAELERWVARLDELGVAHGGIVDAHYGSGVSFRDPDNNALEFFAPPG